MRRPRRNHTVAFKAKGAVAALRGDKTLIQLAQQFDVHANQITQWKTQRLDRAKDSFDTAAERSEKAGSSVRDRQAKIGQLTLLRRIDELHLELPFAGAHMLRDLRGWSGSGSVGSGLPG